MSRQRRDYQDMLRMDRLSYLPDIILHHILSFLDTTSSVRTSVLSRRWRWLWKDVPALNFLGTQPGPSFERMIDHVLSNRSAYCNLSKIETRMFLFHKVIKYAASHSLGHLVMVNANGDDCTPSEYLYRAIASIRIFHRSLTVLEIRDVLLDEQVVRLLSNLQLLETLTLQNCNFLFVDGAFHRFPRLKTLKLVSCQKGVDKCFFICGLPFARIEIHTPKLRFLRFAIDNPHFLIPELFMVDLPWLNHADIEYKSFAVFGDCQKLLELFVGLFNHLHNVQSLNLRIPDSKLLIKIYNVMRRRPSPFKRIRTLSLKCSEGSIDVRDPAIRYFLGGSPYGGEDKSVR